MKLSSNFNRGGNPCYNGYPWCKFSYQYIFSRELWISMTEMWTSIIALINQLTIFCWCQLENTTQLWMSTFQSWISMIVLKIYTGVSRATVPLLRYAPLTWQSQRYGGSGTGYTGVSLITRRRPTENSIYRFRALGMILWGSHCQNWHENLRGNFHRILIVVVNSATHFAQHFRTQIKFDGKFAVITVRKVIAVSPSTACYVFLHIWREQNCRIVFKIL